MKKLVLIAAVAALSACNSSEPAADNMVADDNAMAANDMATDDAMAEASMAVDGQPDAGTYTMTKPDGTTFTETLNADGTISMTEGDTTTNGTWTKKGDATYCITWEGETEATCYTDKMDGTTWTSTNDADPEDTVTIVRAG